MRLMTTQDITNKAVQVNYLQNLLQPTVDVNTKLPAQSNFSETDLLPAGALLSVNPPNLGHDNYMKISEANYLHSNTDEHRDLSHILGRWVIYQAARRAKSW